MLYQIYEAQRSLMEPFADFAQAASKLYSNPLSPFGQHPLAHVRHRRHRWRQASSAG